MVLSETRGPQLSLGAKPVWGLQTAQKFRRPNRPIEGISHSRFQILCFLLSASRSPSLRSSITKVYSRRGADAVYAITGRHCPVSPFTKHLTSAPVNQVKL